MEEASLLELRDFSLWDTLPLIRAMELKEFDAYLGEKGLLFSCRKCVLCGNAMRKTTEAGGNRARWECFRRSCRLSPKRKIGYLKDTFFEGSTSDRRKLFILSYLYLNKMGSQKTWAFTLDVAETTIT